MGGKPNKGTKKDRRLKENKPAQSQPTPARRRIVRPRRVR